MSGQNAPTATRPPRLTLFQAAFLAMTLLVLLMATGAGIAVTVTYREILRPAAEDQLFNTLCLLENRSDSRITGLYLADGINAAVLSDEGIVDATLPPLRFLQMEHRPEDYAAQEQTLRDIVERWKTLPVDARVFRLSNASGNVVAVVRADSTYTFVAYMYERDLLFPLRLSYAQLLLVSLLGILVAGLLAWLLSRPIARAARELSYRAYAQFPPQGYLPRTRLAEVHALYWAFEHPMSEVAVATLLEESSLPTQDGDDAPKAASTSRPLDEEPPAAFLQALATTRHQLLAAREDAAAIAAEHGALAAAEAESAQRLEALRHWALLPRLSLDSAGTGRTPGLREIALSLGADTLTLWSADGNQEPVLRGNAGPAEMVLTSELRRALDAAGNVHWAAHEGGAALLAQYRAPHGRRWILCARYGAAPRATLACEVLALYCLRRIADAEVATGLPPVAVDDPEEETK